MAYALRVEAHERTAMALLTAGALSPTQVAEARDQFDVDLAAAPQFTGPVDVERRELHEALGVA